MALRLTRGCSREHMDEALGTHESATGYLPNKKQHTRVM